MLEKAIANGHLQNISTRAKYNK